MCGEAWLGGTLCKSARVLFYHLARSEEGGKRQVVDGELVDEEHAAGAEAVEDNRGRHLYAGCRPLHGGTR